MKKFVYQLSGESTFIPLAAGTRPDRGTYGQMFEFLTRNKLDENACYGFLPADFSSKTGMSAEQVFELVDGAPADADVVTFSPSLDMSALFINTSEQIEQLYPGMGRTLKDAFAAFAPGCNIRQLVMTSKETVQGNFLAAKPTFWRAWMAACEVLFDISEQGSRDMFAPDRTKLVARLRTEYLCDGVAIRAREIVFECIPSLLLASRLWNVHSIKPEHMSVQFDYMKPMHKELTILDALKFAAARDENRGYLRTYKWFRASLVERISVARTEALLKAGAQSLPKLVDVHGDNLGNLQAEADAATQEPAPVEPFEHERLVLEALKFNAASRGFENLRLSQWFKEGLGGTGRTVRAQDAAADRSDLT